MLIFIMRLRNKNGFTLIEIIVILTVLSITATILSLNYISLQKQSQDDKRQVSAYIVSESLEQYYRQKGEYPNVSTVTNPDAALVKHALNIPTINSLLRPGAPAESNENAWKTGTASATNQLTYTPNTDTSSACLTGTSASDVCADYKVQYFKEKMNAVVTIYSRNTAFATP